MRRADAPRDNVPLARVMRSRIGRSNYLGFEGAGGVPENLGVYPLGSPGRAAGW